MNLEKNAEKQLQSIHKNAAFLQISATSLLFNN